MIPVWVFIIACVVFLGILIHSYIQNNKLRFTNKEISHVLKSYMEQFGRLDWTKVKRKFEDE